jgi:two-component system cell cycle response regulator
MISTSDILNAAILIVDDLQANVRLLENMLRGAGYSRVAFTRDPYEVCALHSKSHYDLILLDVQMPGMDGFRVMEDLKGIETGGYLPVLAITAQPTHKLRALQAGARDFISKPFDLAEVLVRVHNMLEVRLLHQAASNYGKMLESLALYDPLTGLANRRLLSDRLSVASKVIEAASQPYDIEGHAVRITISAGIGIYPVHGEDADTLMKSADLALYDAKRAGKNVYRISGGA